MNLFKLLPALSLLPTLQLEVYNLFNCSLTTAPPTPSTQLKPVSEPRPQSVVQHQNQHYHQHHHQHVDRGMGGLGMGGMGHGGAENGAVSTAAVRV